MPDYTQTPLRKLLNRREITSLLGKFDILLPGYCLSLHAENGQTLAGNNDYSPNNLNTLLANAHAGQMIERGNELIYPLVFGSQIRGALIALRIKQDASPASNLDVHNVLICLNRTLSLLLTKAVETRDVVDETVERYREINLLYHIGETIGTCLDSQEIPQLVLQEANRCIQVNAGVVLLTPEKFSSNTGVRNNFETKASLGTVDHITALQRVSIKIIDNVINTRQPDISTSPFVDQRLEEAEHIFSSIICVPLQVGERMQGVIVLGRLSEQNIFTAGEMKLLMALASQASIALETVRLHLEDVKKQRLEEELAISRKIQLSLLPDAPPTAAGWEFAASYQAARQVGGDLYDFLPLPDGSDRLGLLIADVAGKGIPAGLFMAFCRTIIRMEAMNEGTPAGLLKRTNQLTLQNSHSDLFLTALYAQLNLHNGELVYANAGHDPPFWYRAGIGECQELTSHSRLLGLFDTIHPEEYQIKIAPGDLLVFYTDGITEARDMGGEFFGEERLMTSIMENKAASAKSVLQNIVDAANEFMGDTHQSDDITIIVIKRKKESM